MLDAAVDSGLKSDSNIVAAKHPLDDNGSDKIGKHSLILTEDPDKIADSIMPDTRTVIIAGIAHYRSPDIVHLLDALVRSNRNVVATALNLDSQGRPYRYLPDIMALADDVVIEKALCLSNGCGSSATRSKLVDGTYEPRCTHHYHFDRSPGKGDMLSGHLGLFLGPMYSSKSLTWREAMRRVERTGRNYSTFKWIGDGRGHEGMKPNHFDSGYVVLKNKVKIQAILVRDANDIKEYLSRHPESKDVFIDELQFISGIYDLTLDMMAEGYRFYGTGLPRPFKREKFGEVPDLMCLADRITMLNAYCVLCHHPATENQRLRVERGRRIIAAFNDPLVAVDETKDNVEYAYEPRCLRHWSVEGEPPLKYSFPLF